MQTNPKTRAKLTIGLAALMLGAIASEAAQAAPRHHQRHGHGARIGFYVGAPLLAYSLYRPYFYSPFYYPPVAPVVMEPPVYIEQPQFQPQVIQPPVPQNYQQFAPQYQPQPQSYQPQQQYQEAPQQSANTWYYCAESKAYYPYVKQCAAGWQQVTPQPRS